MQSLLIALQFLTRLPVPKVAVWPREALSRSTIYFPVVGLLVGMGLAWAYWLLSSRWPPMVTSVLVIALWVVVTGALHLDGLADTCDAWMGGATRDEMLRVMRDPHVGLMGIVAIVLALLMKWVMLASLSFGLAVTALLVAPTLGRWACVLVSFRAPYARPEPGLPTSGTSGQAGWSRQFVEQLTPRALFVSTLVAACVVIGALRGWGLVLAILATVETLVLQRMWVGRFGGVTGDTIGATCELVEIGCLVIISTLS